MVPVASYGTVQPLRSAFVLSHMLPPYFYQPFFELLFLAPLLWYCRDRANPRAPLLLGLFVGYYLVASCILYLPGLVEVLWLGTWNWTGKLAVLAFTLLVYMATRHLYPDHRYINLDPRPGFIRWLGLATLAVLVIAIGLALLDYYWLRSLFDWSAISTEELAFQLLVPGWSEEVQYRGLMLGVLMAALRPLPLGGSGIRIVPAIWITGLLFGTAHGFFISADWTFHFDWLEIAMSTVLSGAFFAWMTVRSGSIFTPIMIHTTIFFIVALLP